MITTTATTTVTATITAPPLQHLFLLFLFKKNTCKLFYGNVPNILSWNVFHALTCLFPTYIFLQIYSSLLEHILQNWNISSVGVASVAAIIQEADNERDLFIGIILGISVLVVLLMILSTYLWLRGGRR